MTAELSVDAISARKKRMAAVHLRMSELGVDALILSHGADLPWLTGYVAMPLERLTALVLTASGNAVLVVPELEAPRVPHGRDLFELRPWGELEDPIAITCQILGRGERFRIGISDRAWAGNLLAFQAILGDASWLPASGVTSDLRAVKDEGEVACLRAASAAADQVAMSLQSGDLPLRGRTEAEVSEDISERLVAEGHSHVNFAIVGSGPNGASPHHDAGNRRIGIGDVVVCDFGGTLALDGDVGYCSDITRTVCIGDPADHEVVRCYEVLERAQQAGVDAAAPGVSAESVDQAARRVIEDAGLGSWFIHRTGHGIGIEEHEDPYIVNGNGVILEPGHCFSVEPGIYMPGRFGMRLEDIVVVSDSGCERLNNADHSMVAVDV
ncbi:MAG: M24 family metallopeptidase [Acidimicrobiales bacterium]